MSKKLYIFWLLITFAFAITGFSEEGYEGIQFDFISGDTYMHTAEWVNDRFTEVSNRIDIVETNLYGLGVDVTNKYNFTTNWLTNLGLDLTNKYNFTTNWLTLLGLDLTNKYNFTTNWLTGLGISLTNFMGEVHESTNDIHQRITREVNQLEVNIRTNIAAVNSNLAVHGLMITNLQTDLTFLSTNFWFFYTNVWNAFEATTNRMDGLQGLIETNAGNIFTNNLRIGAIETNISTNLPQIHTNIEAVSNYTKTVEGQVTTNYIYMTNSLQSATNRMNDIENNVNSNYDYMTNALQSATNRMDSLQELIETNTGTIQTNYEWMTNAFFDVTNRLNENAGNIQSNFSYTTNALQSVTNRVDELQGLIETNYDFTTNALTNITIAVESNTTNIADLTITVSDILTNTIPGITNNLGITVIGAETADSDYQDIGNISRVKFDKESGFTVTTNELNEKEVEISLGSAWTTLVPDIPGQTLMDTYQGEWNQESVPYAKDSIVAKTEGTNITYWVCSVETSEVPGESSDWTELKPLKPSGEETLNIKVVVTNETGTFWDYSDTNKNEKTFYIGIGQEIGEDIPYEKVYTSEDITVQGIPYPIGKYTNGSVIAENTSLKTIFGNMFSKAVPPVYTNPVLDVTANGFTKEQTYEYGTQFSGKSLTATVTKWDAGDIEWYAYFTNNYMIVSNDTALTVNVCNLDGFQSLGTLTFKTLVAHKEGPTKKDSYGDDYPSGKIHAGILTNTFSIYGSRYMFWGVKSSQYPVDIASRDAIISLGSSNFVRKVSSLDIVLPKGTHQVIFAVPQFVHVSDIRFKNNFINESIFEDFTTNLVENVYCMNLYSGDGDGGKTYRVYSYFSPQATAEDNTDHVIVGF